MKEKMNEKRYNIAREQMVKRTYEWMTQKEGTKDEIYGQK